MKGIFSIGEAAKAANMTSETLRHYDRIGLVKPSRIDEWTNYRYYSKQDIIRLNAVRALQQMDLSLQEIKEALEYDELSKIIDFLKRAEKKADEKIEELKISRLKIQSARTDYEKKLYKQQSAKKSFTQKFMKRVILLSDEMKAPTLDNLWNYLSHFYDKINPEIKDLFAFEDLAGIYTEKGHSCLFAVCVRFADMHGLKTLPAGTYLCADCTEENRESVLAELLETANKEYNIKPEFTIQMIVVSGILQWNYQIQVPLM